MSRIIRIAILLSLVALFACTKDNSEQSPFPKDIPAIDESAVIQGEVRIKLSEEAATRTGELQIRGTRTGLADLDKALVELGATGIEQLCPAEGKFADARRRAGLHLWYKVNFDGEVTVTRAIGELWGIADIEVVEPQNKVVRVGSGEPLIVTEPQGRIVVNALPDLPFNDPMLYAQWGYKNTGEVIKEGFPAAGFMGVANADINLFPAWNITAGDPDVIVAIVDGGIDISHPDLINSLWVNPGEIAGNGLDDDHNGKADDIYGWNFVDNNATILPHGHGTHVAGIVGAENNNGVGVCGIAGGTGAGDGAKLMSCQIFKAHTGGDDIVASDEMTAATFIYAAEKGAVISQNSWGYDNYTPPSYQYINSCIQYFIENAGTDGDGLQTGPMKGGLVVFASGNVNSEALDYPSSLEYVMAVSATAPTYRKAGYSNYGSWIDIVAPGGGEKTVPTVNWIISTYYDASAGSVYALSAGTSMSAPMVSGVAALAVARYGVGRPGFTSDKLRSTLENTAKSNNLYYYNPGYTGKLGKGMLDAYAALAPNNNNVPVVQPMPNVYFDRIGQQKVIPLTDYFSDADNERLNYTVVSSVAGLLTSGVLDDKLYITLQKNGSGVVTVTARDGNLNSCFTSFSVMARDGLEVMDIFPNPVRDKLGVTFGYGVEGPARFTIYNSAGAKVFDRTLGIDPSETLYINMSSAAGGTYTLVVNKDGDEAKKSFIKY